MFIFDNLIEMDDKNLGALLRTIENDVLVVALKGCNELLKSKIFGCMSSRAAQAIQDEIEDRGPIRLADVVDAQKQVIAAARRMTESGAIMLGSPGGEDFVCDLARSSRTRGAVWTLGREDFRRNLPAHLL